MTATEQNLEMATASVAEIALHFPQSIAVFNQHNIDYCCNGKKSFVQVCTKANLQPQIVWEEIQQKQRDASGDNLLHFEIWDISLLIDFIVQHHHKYVRESIPQLESLLNKVCTKHGADQPQLLAIRKDFYELAEELLGHLPKEEGILFPAIKRLVNNKDSGDLNLSSPVSVMEHEHEIAGKLMKSIRSLSDDYTPHANACLSFQMTYKLLQEFENDLMQHIHLENNILFPKTLKLTQSNSCQVPSSCQIPN
ncbi:MAG TPA: iron-sulfur cluster repair di-iron protein [Cyclobacteriaceae bacterium]|jgi:regulator of cell morphogenesis and NO signaling|nr:iron-sulfur cluster repair di-iron protein [Cyclobacteriaceae bacterium]